MISEFAESFHGAKVVEFDPDEGIKNPSLAYRVRVDWDQKEEGIRFADIFAKFREHPNAGKVRAFLVGDWGGAAEGNECDDVVEALVAARNELKSLEALFIADIIGEECEVSWIQLTDMSPLWNAYPNLIEFRVRGMNRLSLGGLRLPKLRRLIIETGGLPRNVLEEVSKADLPELEHLELWLGDSGYGWQSSIDELDPILSGSLFPKLKYLGLRDSCESDAVAAVAATAPILRRIETLDLSLGTLGDAGAEALAASPLVATLKMLDIHHHYVSDSGLAKLQALGIQVNADDREVPDEWGGEQHRYVAVSE